MSSMSSLPTVSIPFPDCPTFTMVAVTYTVGYATGEEGGLAYVRDVHFSSKAAFLKALKAVVNDKHAYLYMVPVEIRYTIHDFPAPAWTVRNFPAFYTTIGLPGT